jgi:hypothetical protein
MQVLSNHPVNFILDRPVRLGSPTLREKSYLLDNNIPLQEFDNALFMRDLETNHENSGYSSNFHDLVMNKNIRLIVARSPNIVGVLRMQENLSMIEKIDDYVLFSTHPSGG